MSRRMRCGLGLVLGLAGCIPVMPGSAVVLENQELAVSMVWFDAMGRVDSPPKVRWVFPEQQDCVHPRSGRRGFRTFAGCVEGLTISPYAVTVAWRDGDAFSSTTLAHELVHAAQARRLVFDTDHTSREFQPGGTQDQANAMLVSSGL